MQYLKQKAALITAHPSHELRIYHWLCLARPLVMTLTDGAGNDGKPRLDDTRKLLDQTGAKVGQIFAPTTNQAIYQAILDGNAPFFIELIDSLVGALEADQTEYVVGDAMEGYNSAHDACRLVIDAALRILRNRGQMVENFDFLLAGVPDDCPPELQAKAIFLRLDDLKLEQKIQAALAHEGGRGEVLRQLDELGQEAFRVECLRPVRHDCEPDYWSDFFTSNQPFYEQYGRRQVAAGHYRQVLTWAEHMVPIASAIAGYVGKST